MLVDWAALVFVALLALFLVLYRHHPVVEGFYIGLTLTCVVGAFFFGLFLLEGSLVARVARLYESLVSDELKGAPGVYHVVRNVEFDNFDVDYVVIAPAGVFAFEVKTMNFIKPKLELDELARTQWSDQARRAARRIHFLLRSKGLDIDVRPAVALIGPGVPKDLPAYERLDGVRWVTLRDSTAWSKRLGKGALGKEQADEIWAALDSYVSAFSPKE
jgi:hypothetical protein